MAQRLVESAGHISECSVFPSCCLSCRAERNVPGGFLPDTVGVPHPPRTVICVLLAMKMRNETNMCAQDSK